MFEKHMVHSILEGHNALRATRNELLKAEGVFNQYKSALHPAVAFSSDTGFSIRQSIKFKKRKFPKSKARLEYNHFSPLKLRP
jgi:hypothetical protein